jgi:diaminopimelate decarboxylase
MDFAVKNGVHLNIGEISRLEKFGKKYPGSEVIIRFNPTIGTGENIKVVTAGDTKFGIYEI